VVRDIYIPFLSHFDPLRAEVTIFATSRTLMSMSDLSDLETCSRRYETRIFFFIYRV